MHQKNPITKRFRRDILLFIVPWFVLFVVLFLFSSTSVLSSPLEGHSSFDKEAWDNKVFECTMNTCFPAIQTCQNSCEKSSTIPGDPNNPNFLLRLSSLDNDAFDKCLESCKSSYHSCWESCGGGQKVFNDTFGCKEEDIQADGCCPGYILLKKDDETGEADICVIESDEPEITDVKISLGKNVLKLDGEDKISVTMQFFIKDEEGSLIPGKHIKVPLLYANADNNAYIGSILGDTTFSFKAKEGYSKGYSDDEGYYKASIYASNIALGEDADKIGEVEVYVRTSLDDTYKGSSFKLSLPKISIIKIYKNDAKNPARPGAYSAYSISINDPSNLKKEIYLKTAAGSFKLQGESEGTKRPLVKIKTRDNLITFGWMPPEMSRRVRINQIETLKKHLSKLGDDVKGHYTGRVSEELRDNLVERMTKKLPIKGQNILDIYDRANDMKEFSESSLKKYDEMKEDYYKMFDEDSTYTENIVRATLMTEGAYEITDGAISIITDSDDDIKSVIKQRGLKALKESLRNELVIMEAAKGKEYYKFFPLYVKVIAGGKTLSEKVTLTAKAPVLYYEGDGNPTRGVEQ